MSAMRSASSSTTVSIVEQIELLALEQVDQPAGRGDDDLDALASWRICFSMSAPP